MSSKNILFSLLLLSALAVHASEERVCLTQEECIADITQQIRSNTRYPVESVGQSLVATINFKLDADFSIVEQKLITSSGNKEFDQAAMKAIEKTGSFSQLRGLKESEAQTFRNINLKMRGS